MSRLRRSDLTRGQVDSATSKHANESPQAGSSQRRADDAEVRRSLAFRIYPTTVVPAQRNGRHRRPELGTVIEVPERVETPLPTVAWIKNPLVPTIAR